MTVVIFHSLSFNWRGIIYSYSSNTRDLNPVEYLRKLISVSITLWVLHHLHTKATGQSIKIYRCLPYNSLLQSDLVMVASENLYGVLLILCALETNFTLSAELKEKALLKPPSLCLWYIPHFPPFVTILHFRFFLKPFRLFPVMR